MDAITYTAVRANLASAMDRVCDDHEALIITRNGEQSVVMLSLEDYKALEETAYLLRTPANATRLLAAAAQLNAGKGFSGSWPSEADLRRGGLGRLSVLATARQAHGRANQQADTRDTASAIRGHGQA